MKTNVHDGNKENEMADVIEVCDNGDCEEFCSSESRRELARSLRKRNKMLRYEKKLTNRLLKENTTLRRRLNEVQNSRCASPPRKRRRKLGNRTDNFKGKEGDEPRRSTQNQPCG